MCKAKVPVAWVDADGAVHGAASAEALTLALPPGSTIQSGQATACGGYLVCTLLEKNADDDYGSETVTAFSLVTGVMLWPPVRHLRFIGIVDGVAWLTNYLTVEYRGRKLVAIQIATGAVVDMLEFERMGRAAVITDGVRKGCLVHMLYRGMITLYAPVTHEIIWQVENDCSDTDNFIVARGDWICIQAYCEHSPFEYCCIFRRQSDGARVPSLLDPLRELELPQERKTWCHSWWPDEVRIAYGPEHLLLASRLGFAVMTKSHNVGCATPALSGEVTALPPHGPPFVETLISSSGSIVTIDVATAQVLSVRPAPGLAAAWHWQAVDCARWEREKPAAAAAPGLTAAWHWPVADCARREREELAAADAVAAAAAAGLVHTVLTGMLAKDAQ